ncbi:LPXTG cell wall anchor domain-containing protein [Mycetocola miduiensis]|nr:LPXTG cell wall anchor domain-containing protein [Mycetocola miduiensis]
MAGAFLFAASASLGMAATPANDPGLLVSSDGVTFATTLDKSLFDDLALLVPTESTTSDLWIKNPTASPISVRISVEEVDSGSSAFADNLTLTSLVASSGTTRAATLRELSGCNVIVASETLPGRGTVKVHFTASLGDLNGLAGQNDSAPIVLRVEMRDGEAGRFPSTPCEDPETTATASGETLAHTGADASGMLTAGGLLLVAGILLVVDRFRRGRSAR